MRVTMVARGAWKARRASAVGVPESLRNFCSFWLPECSGGQRGFVFLHVPFPLICLSVCKRFWLIFETFGTPHVCVCSLALFACCCVCLLAGLLPCSLACVCACVGACLLACVAACLPTCLYACLHVLPMLLAILALLLCLLCVL